MGYTYVYHYDIWVCLKIGYAQKWPSNHREHHDKTVETGLPPFEAYSFVHEMSS